MIEDLKSRASVAIVTFFYREYLEEHEEISLRHLDHYLGHYDRYIVKPPEIKMARPGYRIKTFPARHFKSVAANSRFLLMKEFYSAFSDYQYILIYELDAIVFSNQLANWVDKGYDYIGAPWPANWCHVIDSLGRDNMITYEAVGNGGFSLRKVKAVLKVLDIYYSPLNRFKFNFMRAIRLIIRLFKAFRPAVNFLFCRKTFKSKSKKGMSFIKNASSIEDHRCSQNEDIFWSFEAKKYYPEFKLPSPDEALSFAFEANPLECFERNNQELPFGSHAWQFYNRDFWEPYLLKT